jgi:putative colanic acid biosynthesis glycosyltransferase
MLLLKLKLMKTILQINTVLNSGPVGRIAEGIGQTAKENGWISYIAYGRNERKSESNSVKIGTSLDVNIHGLKSIIFDNHGFGSVKATRNFIKQITGINPDIIHLHNLHGYYINIRLLFDFLSGTDTPVVWTLHDCWPITGHCVYFDFVKCEKWKTGCFQCPQKNAYPRSLFIDRSRENYSKKKLLFTSVKNLSIVTVSNWLANIVRDSFLLEYPITVINNGINTSLFTPGKLNTVKSEYHLEGKLIILGVSNGWNYRKGLTDFLELSKYIESDIQIILIGLSNHQISSLPSNIIGLNRTENLQKLVQFYSAADIFISTSVEETFGLSIVEAMACGTPVIVYNTTACPEVVSETTGIVVEKNNISALLSAIKTIRNNGKEYYSRSCENRVKSLYDKKDRFLDYIKLYNNLLNDKNLKKTY